MTAGGVLKADKLAPQRPPLPCRLPNRLFEEATVDADMDNKYEARSPRPGGYHHRRNPLGGRLVGGDLDVQQRRVFDPACAIKFTLYRQRPSGSAGDTDIFGAQQYSLPESATMKSGRVATPSSKLPVLMGAKPRWPLGHRNRRVRLAIGLPLPQNGDARAAKRDRKFPPASSITFRSFFPCRARSRRKRAAARTRRRLHRVRYLTARKDQKPNGTKK